MKKSLIVVTIVSVAVLALATAGFAYAQSGGANPGGFGRGGHGMGDGEGLLHEVMVDSMASALGLTPEELETRHEAGETAYDIAISQGLSADEASILIAEARSDALAQAVSEGLITQDQADWMLERQGSMGAGIGECDGTGPIGNGGFGRGRNAGSGYRIAPVNP